MNQAAWTPDAAVGKSVRESGHCGLSTDPPSCSDVWTKVPRPKGGHQCHSGEPGSSDQSWTHQCSV